MQEVSEKVFLQKRWSHKELEYLLNIHHAEEFQKMILNQYRLKKRALFSSMVLESQTGLIYFNVMKLFILILFLSLSYSESFFWAVEFDKAFNILCFASFSFFEASFPSIISLNWMALATAFPP